MKALAWFAVLAAIAWLACAAWNSFKPLPRGLHAMSLPARMTELQVDFIDDAAREGAILARQIAAVGRAEQSVVLDECPLPQSVADALLVRKRQRLNLAVVLVTDPRDEIYGGTGSATLMRLEAAGIIVSRVGLERLRDPIPLYSSLWRLALGWWSNPFDETPGRATLASSLRQRNGKADERRIFVADDGAGGWTSILDSGGAALELRGHLARDIVASELSIAEWSTLEDRLPTAPPVESRGVGTIDARFLTEGAIHNSLLDAVAIAVRGDTIEVMAPSLDDRALIDALSHAAEREATLELLLTPDLPTTQMAAGELLRAGSHVEIRWQSAAATGGRLLLIRHRSDVWLDFTSADFDRSSLGDFNLDAAVELRMPASAAPARAAQNYFRESWASSSPYAPQADPSAEAYWRYRFRQAAGLALN